MTPWKAALLSLYYVVLVVLFFLFTILRHVKIQHDGVDPTEPKWFIPACIVGILLWPFLPVLFLLHIMIDDLADSDSEDGS